MNSLIINPKKETERIIKFLKKTFHEQKINKAVIGLSGGLDSTVAFYLLKEALPPKNIFAYHLPYECRRHCEPEGRGNLKTNEIASVVSLPRNDILGNIEKIITEIKFPTENFKIISINKIVEDLKQLTSNHLTISHLHLGNIMARIRMIILFDAAKRHNALVCGTENKSERLLGYFTRFGDSASDIEPISHLYKTQVIELAKYLGVSQEIIEQKPTAGLWRGQTDEGEFGFTYKQADQVLNLYFDSSFAKASEDKEKITEKIIKLGFKNAKKILSFAQKNQFKQKVPYKI